MQFQLVSAMSNEGPFIIEWLAHHRVIGFTRIIICTNCCNDFSDKLVAALDEAGMCTHLPVEIPEGTFPQKAAYQAVHDSGLISGEDWAMVLDADEFLNIHTGDHSISALAEALPPEADILALNWMTFGSSGLTHWTPEPDTEKFTQSVEPCRPLNGGAKSLVRRPDDFGTLSVHAPLNYTGEGKLCVMNASLDRINIEPPQYRNLWKPLHHLGKAASHLMAQVNHYSIKTQDSFSLRQIRGSGWGDRSQQRHNWEYFKARNQNPVTELSISRYFEARRAEESRIRSHSTIAEIEQDVLDYYRKAIANLKSLPNLA